MDGVFSGMLDIYYAEMSTPETASSAPVYGTPKVLGKGIETTITPVYAEGKLAASNTTIKRKKKITGYDISMNTDNIAPADLKAVLGRSDTTKKVQFVNKDEIAPTIALGFCATYDDGTKEYWWVYKCECAEVTRNMKTEDTDNIEYNTPTLDASAMPLLNNGNLAAIADSNVVTDTTILSGWFTAVFLADPT